MDIELRQKLVMFAMAFGTIINYIIILAALAINNLTPEQINQIVIYFGIGALISIVTSLYVIRQKHQNPDENFTKTIIKLAICHIPTVTGFTLSMIMINI